MPRPEALDAGTLALVRFAAAIAEGDEAELLERIDELRAAETPAIWVEELLLQSLLMVGYPRTLVAMAHWRRAGGTPAPTSDPDADYARAAEWRRRGEATCATVYGDHYRKLRQNVAALHPALDAWMVGEGYGRTLSRPGLDLPRRELCVVAQTAVLDTPRQLYSHLRGALNAGATVADVEATLAAVHPLLTAAHWRRVRELWNEISAGQDGAD
jgi:4-carboxymuconolactone decarboxylase